MSFKKIVTAISRINCQEAFDAVCGMIDTAFQQGKINWQDHETLYAIVGKINVAK